nr:MAG TPA: hypothetical protein [Caudoviricetes sp.]
MIAASQYFSLFYVNLKDYISVLKKMIFRFIVEQFLNV